MVAESKFNPVAGSAARFLVNENGVWMWEGKPIRREELEK